MIEMFRLIDRVAASEIPVLITGESGTGKELVAQAIHQNSPRRAKRFVKENCAAIPANLMESEFFGYRKGAFTGASSDR
jgi:transcriptional regulator with PAS, ATPase and Fis domain